MGRTASMSLTNSMSIDECHALAGSGMSRYLPIRFDQRHDLSPYSLSELVILCLLRKPAIPSEHRTVRRAARRVRASVQREQSPHLLLELRIFLRPGSTPIEATEEARLKSVQFYFWPSLQLDPQRYCDQSQRRY